MAINYPVYFPFKIVVLDNGRIFEYASVSEKIGYMDVAIPAGYGHKTIQIPMKEIKIIERFNGTEYIPVER